MDVDANQINPRSLVVYLEVIDYSNHLSIRFPTLSY